MVSNVYPIYIITWDIQMYSGTLASLPFSFIVSKFTCWGSVIAEQEARLWYCALYVLQSMVYIKHEVPGNSYNLHDDNWC